MFNPHNKQLPIPTLILAVRHARLFSQCRPANPFSHSHVFGAAAFTSPLRTTHNCLHSTALTPLTAATHVPFTQR